MGKKAAAGGVGMSDALREAITEKKFPHDHEYSKDDMTAIKDIMLKKHKHLAEKMDSAAFPSAFRAVRISIYANKENIKGKEAAQILYPKKEGSQAKAAPTASSLLSSLESSIEIIGHVETLGGCLKLAQLLASLKPLLSRCGGVVGLESVLLTIAKLKKEEAAITLLTPPQEEEEEGEGEEGESDAA